MSGFDRCWLTCVFLLSVGYIPSWAAKLQNNYDICKLFEPPGANLRYETVSVSLYHAHFSSFLSFSPLSRTLIWCMAI